MSTLEIIQDRSFIHEWIISSIDIENINISENMEPLEINFNISIENTVMNIYKNNDIFYTLIITKGLSESYDYQTNKSKIICAISDVSGFDLGEYQYDLHVYNNDNSIVFEDSGIINVVENKTGETLKEVRLYDLFGPDSSMIDQLLENN